MREDTRRMRTPRSRRCGRSGNRRAHRRNGFAAVHSARRARRRRAAYRGGTGSLAAVLDGRRAELDAQLALITQEQAVAKAWAFLNFVVPVTEGS
jgi:outer membrane protein TolC